MESKKETVLLSPRNINFSNVDNCNQYYKVRAHTLNRKSENYFYSEILSVEKVLIEIETWDIEVDCDTHSFIANNSIVHNSICKTRIQTGFGVPTLASVWDCGDIHQKLYPNVSIIADGGIRYPADLVKSLAAGADAVICGSVFAGTQESPGAIIYDNNKIAWKIYRGTASEEIQEDKRGGLKHGTCAEGVSQLVEYKGSLNRVLVDFVGGLRSALTYANASNIKELRENAEFIRITGSGINESHAHGTRK
jgi:IMP dehydrogenase/GMP reductase